MVGKKVAFVTEIDKSFTVTLEHKHMRTEYAWMYALDAPHISFHDYKQIRDYDYVIVIWPKGRTFLDQVGCELGENNKNPVSDILNSLDFVGTLKLFIVVYFSCY